MVSDTTEEESADASNTAEDDTATSSTETDTTVSDNSSEQAGETEAPADDADESDSLTAAISADVIQDTIDITQALVDECKIHFQDDSVRIRAVDPANVAMVDLALSSDAFESYNMSGQLIGIDIERFSDIAGMADTGQLMHLTIRDDRKLNVSIGGLSYNLALIDPDSIRQEPDIPDLDLQSEITFEGRDLNRGVKAADMVSEHIRLSTDEEKEVFQISAEGDTDDVELELEREDDLIDMNPAEANSLFSLGYLKDMVKPIDSDAAVTAELGEEFPTKLHFGYAGESGDVTFMLAPRIDSN